MPHADPERRKAYYKNWRATHAEAQKEYAKKWWADHAEERKLCRKKWLEKNPGYQKNYRKTHAKEIKLWEEKYNTEHSARIKARRKKWREKNSDKIKSYQKRYDKSREKQKRAYQLKYTAARRLRDPNFKIQLNLRRRIHGALNGVRKSAKTIELLGCSISELRQHLESQFQPGMTWENYGFRGWHVDHKRPCAKFDLTDPAQQKQCFHYTNLQPLWADENMRKGAK